MVTAVKINVIPHAVNVVPQGLRVIRGLQVRRGLKGIPDVPGLRVTGEIRGQWDRRGYPVHPAQEVPEGIPVP